MSSYNISHQYNNSEIDFEIEPIISPEEVQNKAFTFKTDFRGYMEMYNPPEVVSKYLDQHQEWFPECAKPMQTEAIADKGYTLTIGRFGSFGYEVEPKMSVVFEVTPEKKYLMYSIDTPGYETPGYQVEYDAMMDLNPISLESSSAISPNYGKKLTKSLPSEVTQVTWELHLKVCVWFPKFIHRLPVSVIQSTGDRLLSQIVRQVSPCLTLKVQKNFHEGLNLPLPLKNSRYLEKITEL